MSELFDTNILIDHLNGVTKATREITRSKNPAIGVITWIEVMTGLHFRVKRLFCGLFCRTFSIWR